MHLLWQRYNFAVHLAQYVRRESFKNYMMNGTLADDLIFEPISTGGCQKYEQKWGPTTTAAAALDEAGV